VIWLEGSTYGPKPRDWKLRFDFGSSLFSVHSLYARQFWKRIDAENQPQNTPADRPDLDADTASDASGYKDFNTDVEADSDTASEW
jgi:hypothetical protein